VSARLLDEVGDVHGHLLDLRVVKLLDVLQVATVVLRYEIDGHALATEPTTAPDPGWREGWRDGWRDV
jgi:hypothetical protein